MNASPTRDVSMLVIWSMLILHTLSVLAVTTFLFVIANIGDEWVSAVLENGRTGNASRATTTWSSPTLTHSVMTARGSGQSISEWGKEHADEYLGMSEALEVR